MTRAKIYTKTGDRGQTSLVGGTRVSKSDVRLEAYGTLDELNSVVGLVRTALSEDGADAALRHLDPRLRRVQHALFNIGSHLACEDEKIRPHLPALAEVDVTALEADMDQWENELPPLKNFILPGGTELAARAHVSRTVCRRAERAVQRMIEHDLPVEENQAVFLNRLSDWFFLLSRIFNAAAGVADVIWEK
jgi:cob(I)alamin adenosyltransferase